MIEATLNDYRDFPESGHLSMAYPGLTIRALDGREINVHYADGNDVAWGQYLPDDEGCVGLYQCEREKWDRMLRKAFDEGAAIYSLLPNRGKYDLSRIGVDRDEE